MNHTLPAGRCPVDWCDQGERHHTEHELTVGTWPGTSHSGPRRSIVAQLVIHGHSTDDATPMLALVDQLDQVDVDLTWDEAHQLATAIIAEARRHRRLTADSGEADDAR